jgi:hypothetical protein
MLISNTEYFKSNNRQLRVEMIEGVIPVIYVSPIANAKMQHYVDIVNDEVGWMGTVEELDSGDYYIEDVYLFDQEVNGATTEIGEDSLAKFATEMLKEPDGMEIMNKMRFWGHSHVNMATGPSGQDDSQMEVFSDCGHDFFIRGIFNKKGEVNWSVYHYSRGVIFHHLEWQLYTEESDELRDQIEDEIREKVKKKTYPRPMYTGHQSHGRNIPVSSRYPQAGAYNPSNPESWSMPAQDKWPFDLEDDDFDLDEDEKEYLDSRESLLDDSSEDMIGQGIDDDESEMSEEEYKELVQNFHQDIANRDIEEGRIPDDPQKYKYRGKQ